MKGHDCVLDIDVRCCSVEARLAAPGGASQIQGSTSCSAVLEEKIPSSTKGAPRTGCAVF